MAGVLGVLAFAVLILFAIFFHELGHFLTARWAGIKVSKFFIGFGPTLWSVRRGVPETVTGPDGTLITRPETEYGIKALPLGGFVKVVGMSPLEEITPEEEPRSFGAARPWKRAIVLAAGSVTHFITAFIVLYMVFLVIGVPDPNRPTLVVDAVQETIGNETSPASKAGLRPGDRIVEVDGRSVRNWTQMRDRIRSSEGRELVLTVVPEEGGRRVVELSPIRDPDQPDDKVYVVGIFPRDVLRKGPIIAAKATGTTMKNLLVAFVDRAPQAFSPRSLGLSGGPPTSDRAFSIVGAGRLAADLANQGQVAIFLLMFVQINVFVAVLNMFPLPPLDGGHLLLLGIEKLRGKPLGARMVVAVTAFVMGLIILLGVLLVYYDIVSPVRLPVR